MTPETIDWIIRGGLPTFALFVLFVVVIGASRKVYVWRWNLDDQAAAYERLIKQIEADRDRAVGEITEDRNFWRDTASETLDIARTYRQRRAQDHPAWDRRA
jgi:hypothetical protein